ncbi:MAG TPA: NUDIX hydrolase [Chloroflexota bacterium]|jgi:8-oxo-dGTP diphosphatase|nr:NUDIX hydrolase [Chloroflexota bacterium]
MVKYCLHCGAPLAAREIEGYRRPACTACGWVYYPDPKVAVAVLVGRDGRILLNRRAIEPGRGRWSFPSGYVNRGEVLEEAARREVREETALDVEIEDLFGVYSERGNPVVLVVYTARAAEGEPRAGSEVWEVGWFAPDALPPMAFPHDHEIVARWAATRAGRR